MATTEEILKESTEVAQGAAESIGGTFTEGVGFTPNEETTFTNPNKDMFGGGTDYVDSETMQPVDSIDFDEPTDSTVDVGGLNLTPSEVEEQEQTDELTDLISSLEGESAFIAEQEEEQDIEGLTAIQQEQATLVQNLQLEAQNLANQFAGVEDVMQQESEGRGRTVGGLAPLTAGERRKIAIQQRAVASQALTAYAAYNVAKGNLELAQTAVDKAVAAKYDPIREAIDIKMKNLELLVNSPTARAEDRKRAEDKQKELEAEQKAVEEQAAFNTSIQNIYIQMAAKPGVDPAITKQIKDLLNKDNLTIEDVALATTLAEQAGVLEEEAGGVDIENFRQFFPDVDITTPEGQQQFLDWQAKMDRASPTGASKDQPMSPNQIEQFRRSYNWTPPPYSWNQLVQLMEDNPGYSTEELEEEAWAQWNKTNTGTTTDTGVPEPAQPRTVEDTISTMMDTITEDQVKNLKGKAKAAGTTGLFRIGKGEVEHYLNSISDRIQTALDAGFTPEQILAELAK